MKIVTVSSTNRKAGKTSFACLVLKKNKGFSALKITTVSSGSKKCSRKGSCGICNLLEKKWEFFTEPKDLLQKGKDTYRLKKAGARKVAWLLVKKEALRQGLRKALLFFKGQKGLVIESNSALRYIKPDLAVLLVARGRIKPSAQKLLELEYGNLSRRGL